MNQLAKNCMMMTSIWICGSYIRNPSHSNNWTWNSSKNNSSREFSKNHSLFLLSPLWLLGENKLYFLIVWCSIFSFSPSSAQKWWWANILFCFLLGYIFLGQEIWDTVQWSRICLMMTCRSNMQLIQFHISGNGFDRRNFIFLQNIVR